MELEAVPYPFEHAKGSLTLATFVTDDMPPEDLEPTEFHQGAHVLGCVTDVFGRAYGRLGLIVEGVDASLGLEPLEPPTAETPASG